MLLSFFKHQLRTLRDAFQWAPTLGGECYSTTSLEVISMRHEIISFQWAPTLGGECYLLFW